VLKPLLKRILLRLRVAVIRAAPRSTRFDVLPLLHQRFFGDLLSHTNNFKDCRWLGVPIWQNILDLWVIQETLCEVQPDTLIECGTNKGGSALFYAHIFDLLGKGKVISVDIVDMQPPSHPRIEYILGSSIDPMIAETIRSKCTGITMAILDSCHDRDHVFREMEIYGKMVTPNSYMLVQDGIMDVIDNHAIGRPGPLPAIESFLSLRSDFEADTEKSRKFLISHHPKGWLRRVRTS
jgi:cephalosporin hydroxylase